jgi:hypothetical protein
MTDTVTSMSVADNDVVPDIDVAEVAKTIDATVDTLEHVADDVVHHAGNILDNVLTSGGVDASQATVVKNVFNSTASTAISFVGSYIKTLTSEPFYNDQNRNGLFDTPTAKFVWYQPLMSPLILLQFITILFGYSFFNNILALATNTQHGPMPVLLALVVAILNTFFIGNFVSALLYLGAIETIYYAVQRLLTVKVSQD